MLNGHGGVVIGSEMSGDVRKVTISNCVFDGTARGIRLKTMRGRGGIVEEIRVENIVMKNVGREAITLNMHYNDSAQEPVSERTPRLRDIHISNITGRDVEIAGLLVGISEMPIAHVSFNNINIYSREGFLIRTAENIRFHDVEVNVQKGAALLCENVNGLEIDGFSADQMNGSAAMLEFLNVQGAFIRNCVPQSGVQAFLKAGGKKTGKVVLGENYLDRTEMPLISDIDLPADAVIWQNKSSAGIIHE